MTVAVTDTRLLEGLAAAVKNTQSLALTGHAAGIRDIAVGLLKEGLGAFEAAVAAENRAELDALEDEHDLPERRVALNEAFGRLYLALQSGVLQRRIKGQPEPQDLSHYLTQNTPATFAAIGLDRAIEGLDRARGFALPYVPTNIQDGLSSVVDDAIAKARAQREKVMQTQSGDAQLTELERIREHARERYLSARDLVGAALREAKNYDALPEVMPGLTDVLAPA